MKYALLGGGGVFAVHTAAHLLDAGHEVVSIGRNIPRGPHCTLRVGDGDPCYAYEQIHIVFEQDRLMQVLDRARPDVVINFAALAYATSWQDAHRYYDTNLVAVSRICEALGKRDYLKKFVQIGTSELYGSVSSPVNEDAPLHPTSPYAVSKMAADLHLETLWSAQQFPMNIVRPSNAYGPGQQVWRLLPRAVLCALTGEKLPLQGGGAVSKSYIHAADLARAIRLVAENAPPGRIYNIGPDEPVSIRLLVGILAETAGVRFETLCVETEGRAGEDSMYWLDSSRIRDELGWTPRIDLHEGVRDMLNWGRAHVEALKAESRDFTLHA